MQIISKAVVIPIYKETLDEDEFVSFTQCLRILGKHPIVIVCPDGMDTANYEKIAQKEGVSLKFNCLDKSFFSNVKAYNRLMLDKNFYLGFSQYTYILIYQLDAFVFKDDFEYWCSLGYDYIGAPWFTYINKKGVSLFFRRIYLYYKRKLHRLSDKPNKQFTTEYGVGNGGFSLRNIKKLVEVIERSEQNGKINKYRNSSLSHDQEDVFWAYEVKSKLKMPSYRTALKFSIEEYPKSCLQLNRGELPFGCHAWRKFEVGTWKPYIEQFGYKVSM